MHMFEELDHAELVNSPVLSQLVERSASFLVGSLAFRYCHSPALVCQQVLQYYLVQFRPLVPELLHAACEYRWFVILPLLFT